MSPLSKYQLERVDLLTTIEQGRRVETELFAENSRGLRTMGELLKARLFGSTQWAIDLRKRMTNYVQGAARTDDGIRRSGPGEPTSPVGWQGPPPEQVRGVSAEELPGDDSVGSISTTAQKPPEPHSWPCGDPYCQPCDDAVKRLLRDVGVLPRKGGTR
jgi:hypothetical protein